MPNQLIAGRYQMFRAIGCGGMGTVWLCRDEVLGREVAVKQMGALPGESATETKRAMREARSAAAFSHPNAVAVYDVLIDKAGRPKISDFGIARGHGDDQLTAVGFITGTPEYLSPELARCEDPRPASDVWALGATLYAAVEAIRSTSRAS